MLTITIPPTELYSYITGFSTVKGQTLRLEHSLRSVSLWESKWKVNYLNNPNKSKEADLDYVRCMTLNKNVKSDAYNNLSPENISQIKSYIDAPMSATTFSNGSVKGKINNEQVTSELLYYWMVSLNIPFECEKWHLNRLINLIKICNIKNQPGKKLTGKELISRNAAINAANRKRFRSKG